MSQFKADSAAVLDAEPAESLVQSISEAVADAEGVETWDLTPLYEAIDPGALGSLIGSAGPYDDSFVVTFDYHGYDVTVTADGTVELEA